MEQITLFKHVTDGGAVYLTDNHSFADAKLVIRLDGGPELIGCKITETDTLDKKTEETTTKKLSKYQRLLEAAQELAKTWDVIDNGIAEAAGRKKLKGVLDGLRDNSNAEKRPSSVFYY